MSTDILACQVSNDQFVILTLHYIQQMFHIHAAMPFSFKTKIE